MRNIPFIIKPHKRLCEILRDHCVKSGGRACSYVDLSFRLLTQIREKVGFNISQVAQLLQSLADQHAIKFVAGPNDCVRIELKTPFFYLVTATSTRSIDKKGGPQNGK